MRVDSVMSSFDQVIGLLYESVVCEAPWQRFMDVLLKATGSSAMSIQKWRNNELLVKVESETAEISRLNELLKSIGSIPVGLVTCASEINNINELSPRNDLLSIDLMDLEGSRVAIRLMRSSSYGPYSEIDKNIMARLSDHLIRALGIYQNQLSRSSGLNIYTYTSEQLPLGIVALNDVGKIINCNSSAEIIMGRSDCVVRDGKNLTAFDADDGRKLNQLVQKVILDAKLKQQFEPESMRLRRKGSNGYIYVLIRALKTHKHISGSRIPSVAVYLSEDESVYAPPQKLLRQMFGLTKAEASLVNQMVRGQSLGDACVQLGRSHNTGRSQLSSIFSKVGVNKQAELVRAVFNSVASLALSKDQESIIVA